MVSQPRFDREYGRLPGENIGPSTDDFGGLCVRILPGPCRFYVDMAGAGTFGKWLEPGIAANGILMRRSVDTLSQKGQLPRVHAALAAATAAAIAPQRHQQQGTHPDFLTSPRSFAPQ